ncbi:MAG: hypothetical protein JXB38_15795 [Anaerolineales bacterium]|nr:hypothetical protein [Anaerolineales bacterium]
MQTKRTTLLFTITLALAVLLQAWQIVPTAFQDLAAVRKTIGQHGLWRSANFGQNQKFADLVIFLNAQIPVDGRVVLPPRAEAPGNIGSTSHMQFFLTPRAVLNCTTEFRECLIHYGAQENTYILFSDLETVIEAGTGIPAERILTAPGERAGVIIPAGMAAATGITLQPFDSLLDVLRSTLGPISFLFFLVAIGFVYLHTAFPQLPTVFKLALGYGLTLGLYALVLFALALAGLPVAYLSIGIAVLLVFLPALWIGLTPTFRKSIQVKEWSEPRWSVLVWHILLILLGGIVGVIAVGKGYHRTDALVLWGAKGYGIAAEGLTSGAQWGTLTTEYPLNVPLLIATLKVLFKEILPASKFLFGGYYLGILLGVYAYLEKQMHSSVAGLAALMLGTVPIIFQHGENALANLPLTYYYLFGTLLLTDMLVETQPRNWRKAIVAGSTLTLAAWTRPEGLAAVILLLVYLAATNFHKVHRWGLAALPLVLFLAVWIPSSSFVYPQGARSTDLTRLVLRQTLQGNLHFQEIGYVLVYFLSKLFQVNEWGLLGYTGSLAFVYWLTHQGTRPRWKFNCIGAGLAFMVLVFGLYYVTSYDQSHDISWWVSTGLSRMMMPGLVTVGVGLVLSLFQHSDSEL